MAALLPGSKVTRSPPTQNRTQKRREGKKCSRTGHFLTDKRPSCACVCRGGLRRRRPIAAACRRRGRREGGQKEFSFLPLSFEYPVSGIGQPPPSLPPLFHICEAAAAAARAPPPIAKEEEEERGILAWIINNTTLWKEDGGKRRMKLRAKKVNILDRVKFKLKRSFF